MSVDHLLRMPCSIQSRSQTVDDWGQPQNAPAEVTGTTCYLEPIRAAERLAGQDTGDVDVRIFLPAGTEVDRSSTITVEGKAYEVVGDPAIWTRPTDLTVSHITADCRAAG